MPSADRRYTGRRPQGKSSKGREVRLTQQDKALLLAFHTFAR